VLVAGRSAVAAGLSSGLSSRRPGVGAACGAPPSTGARRSPVVAPRPALAVLRRPARDPADGRPRQRWCPGPAPGALRWRLA